MADIRKELNSFTQSVVAGQIAMSTGEGSESLTVQMKSTYSGTALAAGSPVKYADVAGYPPQVDVAVPGNADVMCGIILYTPRANSFEANDIFQITTKGSIIYLPASAALARGSQVGLTADYKLKAANNLNYIGILLDKATAADQLVRVQIDIPVGKAYTIS